jgi:hypothetical protein
MDDNTKMMNQNTPQVVQDDQAQSQAVVQPVQPSVSGGMANKEIAPTPSTISELKPSGPEVNHEINQELKDIGVEEKKDSPDLTFEHKELGVDHAGPHIPVSSAISNKVQLPMSEEEIEKQLKTGQNDDSGKWLAGLVRKIMKVIGL